MSIYIKVPTWSPQKQWHYTSFATRVQFRDFVKTLFKEPGKYSFDDTSELFNSQARHFQKNRLFCEAPELSRDYIEYWDTEKEKCRKGVIFHNDKGDTWYLPRFYYHWLNFLHIFNKSVGKFTFPEIRDVQYHMGLYEILALLHDLDATTLKARQKASSYFHLCKLYNKYLFEEGYVGKVLASNKDFMIQPNGSWKFLDHYHNFTNANTAWACTNMPDAPLNWQQKVETKTADGRKVKIGTMATIVGISLNQSPTASVGGSCTEAFYEEGGIAPTADETHIYMRSSMKEGGIVSGMFSIAGSVGKLDSCGPLKDFTLNPAGNAFYSVKTNLLDKHGTEGWSGLFIPEQWGMPPYIDKYGNSMIKEALEYLDKQDREWKNGYIDEDGQKIPPMKPELYQIERSQHPRNIEEAFAIRTVSVFPVKHTTAQVKRIEEGQYHIRHVELEYDNEHKMVERKCDRQPISQFPLPKTTEDKRGVICIHESPVRDTDGIVPWRAYYASCDPVEKDKTVTSDSLFCIYVYKNPIEVTQVDAEGNSNTFIEGDKLVAWWTGRYDDVNETNEQARKIIEYYNAYTLCENNKTSLGNYLISKNMSKHLVPSKEILFDRELENEQKIYDKWGWSKSAPLWKVMMEYGVDYLSEVLKGPELLPNGNVLRPPIYGVSRIPDIMLLREMQQYQEKGNYDRIIAYTALIAFVKKQETERGIKKITRRDDKATEKKKIHTFTRGLSFKSVGRSTGTSGIRRGKTFRSIG